MLTEAPETLTADVVCEDDTIRIEVDVPGLQPRLDVHARDHIVVVDGSRSHELAGHYLLHERGRTFHREFHLPGETDMWNVRAHIHDGVLTIEAPFGSGRAEQDERRIEIRPSTWACHPDAAAI